MTKPVTLYRLFEGELQTRVVTPQKGERPGYTILGKLIAIGWSEKNPILMHNDIIDPRKNTKYVITNPEREKSDE